MESMSLQIVGGERREPAAEREGFCALAGSVLRLRRLELLDMILGFTLAGWVGGPTRGFLRVGVVNIKVVYYEPAKRPGFP